MRLSAHGACLRDARVAHVAEFDSMSARPTVVVTRKLPASVEEIIAQRFDAKFNRMDVALTPEQMADVLKRTAD